MSQIEQVRRSYLRGHGLLYGGWTRGPGRKTRMGPGPAICSCGQESVTLPTTAARQRWHRDEHKPAARRVLAQAKEEA